MKVFVALGGFCSGSSEHWEVKFVMTRALVRVKPTGETP